MSRILIIEDNADNLELMTYLLKALGHTPLTAGDGEEGLEAARRNAPDLIICDLQLPRMDGYGVIQRLKGHPALRAIPVVAVTAYAMVGDRDRVLAAGFDGYIPKPIAPETFVGQIEVFLKADQRPARPEATHDTRHTTPDTPIRATVLVVDNSPVNLDIVRSTLEPFGYKVISAGGVQEALALARQTPPDMILSDLHMPDRDGYDFIKAVQADPQLRLIPFVFLSSTVWGGKDVKHGLDLGAAKFILRPIEPEALLAEIETILKK